MKVSVFSQSREFTSKTSEALLQMFPEGPVVCSVECQSEDLIMEM